MSAATEQPSDMVEVEAMRFRGELIEAGDDELGRPTVMFSTTREDLSNCRHLPYYQEVEVVVVMRVLKPTEDK